MLSQISGGSSRCSVRRATTTVAIRMTSICDPAHHLRRAEREAGEAEEGRFEGHAGNGVVLGDRARIAERREGLAAEQSGEIIEKRPIRRLAVSRSETATSAAESAVVQASARHSRRTSR